jgi:RNA polymerase sigma factor (sigma-70 family)
MNEMDTREALLIRVRSEQDNPSWEEFTSVYERYIYLVIRGMKVDHHDAEDLVQTVLLAIWQKIPEYHYQPSRAKFRTWLCRITHNKVIDYLRHSTSESRKKEQLTPDLTSLPEIEKIAEREWKAHITDKAWQNIQKSFNGAAIECFQLMQQAIEPKEIAIKLNISNSSVYVLFKRVKDTFLREVRRLDSEWR